MKKRLLSAALALAMVLTLLPATIVPAFAVTYQAPGTADPSGVVKSTDKDGNDIHFYEKTTNNAGEVTAISTVTVSRCTTPGDGTGREYGEWYWLNNKNPQEPQYNKVSSGFVVGNNGSGLWYPNETDFTTTTKITYNGVANTDAKKLRSTTFTMLGTTSLDMSAGTWADTTLNVDIEGSGKLTLAENATNVTVTSKFVSGTKTGQVVVPARTHKAYSTTSPTNAALTLNATNVIIDGNISLTGRSNQITLTNCEAAGISMDGETVTARTSAGVETTSYLRQTLTATNSKITGAIDIKGDGSTVSLTSVNGGTSATPGDTVSIEGHGGSLTIAGASNVGAVTAKSRAASSTQTTIGNIPSITVSGGTVASVSTAADLGPGSANITLNRTTGNTNVGAVSVKKGSVSVAAGVTTTTIAVPEGSLTITGNTATNAAIGTGATTGVVTLGANGPTTLSVSGYGNDMGGITVANGNGSNLDIRSWPTGRNNDFGTLALNDYAKKQIAGGTFATSLPFSSDKEYKWINTTNLTYQAVVNSKTALYNKDELGQAIDDVNKGGTTAAATAGNIRVIGQAGTYKLTMKYGQGDLAIIQFSALTPMILPSRINSKNIVSWMQVESGSVVNTFVSGQSYNIPARDIIVNATNVSEDVAQITGVTVATSTSVVTGTNIRATLNGTTINLSGAVGEGVGTRSGITLTLTTDVIDTNGDPVKLEDVEVDFDPATKATQFNSFWVPTNGARVENGQLVLANGTRYTVNGSGLAVSASNLKLATNSTEIAVTVGGRMASWKQEAKDDLIALLNGGSAKFEWSTNKAMLEAVNAAQASITNTTTVTGWINTARTNVWSRGVADSTSTTGYKPNMTPHSGTYANAASDNADKMAITTKFADAYIVPYLMVNVTDYDESGTLTATLTPYFRVDVSAAGGYDPTAAYTVQAGRALSDLTGDMSTPVKVTFNLGGAFATQKMHQDGKYVYTGDGGAWEINHAGTTGLGTIQINGVDGLIELTNAQTGAKIASGKYDSLQAAVDDTIPETTVGNTTTYSKIKIDSAFNGSCSFTMTGAARTIEIQALGNKEVSCSSTYVDKTDLGGDTYTFQLRRDTTVVTGNVDIAVNTAANGSAAASVSKTAAGQVVTVTAYPATGYVVGNVTAVTNANANVPVSSAGNNQYTFTVPANATKVTVTPTFVVGDNKATFAVNSNTSQGTAVVTTGTTDGKAQQGSTVTVTTVPSNSGYRTIGLTARGNNGSTAAVTRTGTNTFNVTVPSGATTVTVTPSFDINTGTPFTDVLSSHWASSYVTWAYQNNYIKGTGTYTYSPANYMTRGEVVEMLYKAAGSPSVAGLSNPFTDVTPTSHWAYNAFIWAYHQGLISGGTINPFGYATRAEIVEILYKRAGSPTVYGTSGFADVASNATYSKAVTWARQKGLTNGYSGNTYFRPGYAVSRAEMAAFLQRAFGK